MTGLAIGVKEKNESLSETEDELTTLEALVLLVSCESCSSSKSTKLKWSKFDSVFKSDLIVLSFVSSLNESKLESLSSSDLFDSCLSILSVPSFELFEALLTLKIKYT